MLTNTVPALQSIIKNGDAKQAAYAAQIIRSISEKKPDDILRVEKDNLTRYIDIYHKYQIYSIPDLKIQLSNLNTLPAIDIIIILHIIGNLKKPSLIIWPEKTKYKDRIYDYTQAVDFTSGMFDSLPTRKTNPSIIQYAETTIVPSGKFRGMKFDHNRAPQLKEPLGLLSPDSPYREITLMTPAQWGKSTLAELVTMYYIQKVPSEIMYVSSNETAAIKWLERRIVPRAEAAGIYFRSEVESRQSRKTGDTSYSKIFPGGNIDIASALSPAQLASETKRIVLGDETDRWKVELGAEGSVVDMIRARTQAWGNQAKILWISTPTTENASLILQFFLQGDQRFYYVPCPYCGTMQLLDFSYGRGHGLKWEHRDGQIYKKSIELICENQHCGRGIKESSKNKILNGGEWRASAAPKYEYLASFNSNGLYSHMLTWYDMVVGYEEAQTSAVKKQAFENLKMGRPYRDTGTRPKVEKLIENRGSYRMGDVPEGVLYLTAGIDVQRGSKNDPDNPPRLEMEVLGIGAGYKTWSIEYRRFEGEIFDPYSGAWELLHQYAIQTELTYSRKIDGFRFPVSLVFVDSGDGENSDIVYRFCQRWQNTYPSKGFGSIKRRKTEAADELTESNIKRYRPVKIGEDVTLYEISTVYYKNQIYNNLRVPRLPVDPQKPGFCDFPIDYSERYFNMLTAEEKLSNGSFDAKGRRNEALDCRVYALCAGDVYLDAELLLYKSDAKARGLRPDQIQTITHRTVIDEIARQTGRRDVKK
jgi:phage terminase large subunit GpA-like protein